MLDKTLLYCILITGILTLLFSTFLSLPIDEKDDLPVALIQTATQQQNSTSSEAVSEKDSSETLPVFTKESLARYNGEDPDLPIYLAFEGNVYDVTAGAQYYAPGGAYDFLAGTDGTTMLKIAGGSIIKKKYPIIGTYVE